MSHRTQVLRLLTRQALQREAMSTAFPKWQSLCLLRRLRLPTLDAAFVPPYSPRKEIRTTAEALARAIGTERLLVRSDGGRETTQYFRGGNTTGVDAAVATAIQLSQVGRAVIFLEPTNRFASLLAVNLLASRDGVFAAEILGPGYDSSDLNRGGILPQYVIHVDVGSWESHRSLWWSDLRMQTIDVDSDERRQRRLHNVGAWILPALGVANGDDPIATATTWLRAQGHELLWSSWRYRLDLSDVQAWYDDLYLIGAFLNEHRAWRVLALCASVLSDSRFVYWEVVDGACKWQLPASHRYSYRSATIGSTRDARRAGR